MDVAEVVKFSDTDSDDSDIFIIKQIKPVSRLTLQQALIIKHSVLNPEKSKSPVKNTEVKNKKVKYKKVKNKVASKQLVEEQDCQLQKKHNMQTFKEDCHKNNATHVISKEKKTSVNKEKKSESLKRSFSEELKPNACMKLNGGETTPTKITDYFTGYISNETQKNEDNFENQLSPGISKKRKKLKMNNGNSKSAERRSCIKKPLIEEFNKETEDSKISSPDKFKNINISIEFGPFCEPEFENNFMDVLNSVETLNEESFEDNGELLSFLLKKVVHSEVKKQNTPESFISENGVNPQNLLSENEEQILKKFLYLNSRCSKVLVRMLCRKNDWHRVLTLNLKDVKNCKEEFNILYKGNFVDLNIGETDLKTKLNLLSKSEVLELCKKFLVLFKSVGSYKKEDLINSLLESSKNQKSALDMLKKNNSNSRLTLLEKKVKCTLGTCVKLSATTVSAFNKIMVLFSFAHNNDDETKRFSNQLFMCLKVFKNMIKFPSYKLSPCVVFETRADFEEYVKALMLQNSFQIASVNKKFDEFTDIAKESEAEFRRLLSDEKYKERFLRLKPFLKKFNGGTIYAKILTDYCNFFKKQTKREEIISVAELLLSQNIFLSRKRGEWYSILSKVFAGQKKMNVASEVLIRGLNDPFTNEVQKLTLQLGGQVILKGKSNGVNDENLKEALRCACTVELQEPPSIEIRGQALQGNEKGYKCVYVEESDSGKLFLSVEEKAISYYKSNGYPCGLHVEGFIVYSMYFLFFYDLIYGLSPVGVFQTPYQDAPLDFYSSYFYLNRKNEIDLFFSEMLSWSAAEIEAKLRDAYNKNVGTTCLITWSEGYTPELYYEVLTCLGMPFFVSICRRLVKNFGATRSGFPDLTLWNPKTKKCKFVEVKSPMDKLSPAQRVWLDFLAGIGIDCEVCNVKNINGKKLASS